MIGYLRMGVSLGELYQEKGVIGMSTKKQMDIEEFVEFGYLQEANRRYFHPLGLELLITLAQGDEESDAKLILSGLWDRRASTKVLLSKVDLEKAKRITSEMQTRRVARRVLPECNSSGFQKVPRG